MPSEDACGRAYKRAGRQVRVRVGSWASGPVRRVSGRASEGVCGWCAGVKVLADNSYDISIQPTTHRLMCGARRPESRQFPCLLPAAQKKQAKEFAINYQNRLCRRRTLMPVQLLEAAAAATAEASTAAAVAAATAATAGVVTVGEATAAVETVAAQPEFIQAGCTVD